VIGALRRCEKLIAAMRPLIGSNPLGAGSLDDRLHQLEASLIREDGKPWEQVPCAELLQIKRPTWGNRIEP
jgi:hypothetical protein